MSHMKHLNHLKIPIQVIKDCTQDFDETNFIGKGGYGRVYKGILSWVDHKNQPVAVKRLDVTWGQGNKEFYTEITTLSQYKHKNIITFVGFCDDSKEMILVYEYASHGSLDTYLRDVVMLGKLSWPMRLNICIGVASALDYLHNHVAEKHRIIHRDIKSANILLDENWNAKLSDFGLSTIGLANQQNTFLITNVAGTHGYCDPQYEKTGILTKESDVYSLGVVLFEVLCGRLVCVIKYHDERRFLHHLARTYYENGELHKIIDFTIKDQIVPIALKRFSDIAYQCLQETREERPIISKVLWELEEAGSVVGGSRISPTVAALLIQMSFWSFMLKKNCSSSDNVLLIQMSFVSRMMRKYYTRTHAILLMGRTFRILKIRRAENLLALSDLSNAKLKLEELNTLFHDDAYRDQITNDEHERQKYKKKITVLRHTIDEIKGSDAFVRSSKRSMMNRLKDMIIKVELLQENDHLVTMKRRRIEYAE